MNVAGGTGASVAFPQRGDVRAKLLFFAQYRCLGAFPLNGVREQLRIAAEVEDENGTISHGIVASMNKIDGPAIDLCKHKKPAIVVPAACQEFIERREARQVVSREAGE